MPIKREPYFQAILQDARLVHETVVAHEDRLASAARNMDGQIQITAETSATNEVTIRVRQGSEDGPRMLAVDCDLKVEVRATSSGDQLIEYQNKYRAFFEITEQTGIRPDLTGLPPVTFAPYVAHTNWLAVRRADGTLAATGIAQVRLNMPRPDLGVAESNAERDGLTMPKKKLRTAKPARAHPSSGIRRKRAVS